MTYLVFARKYRPQKFDEVIGQEHITRTLKNALSEKRIAHAYLFSGPRGTGKTTTARIFAKGLNCVNGPTAEPCQNCIPCKEITQGISVDVLEIDAASNRGIDEIRTLRENVRFAPASCRYKVYIIDEAHQITGDAFNALLKTLEEPPGYVVFIFATTEPQKVPLTILSRCQRYAFRLVSLEKIIQRLEEIVKKENLSVESEATSFIARLAQGSVRDAESLLDESVSFSPQGVKVKDLIFLLNLLPQEYLIQFGQAFLSADKQKVLNLITEVNDLGYNLQQVVKDLREYFRQLLILKFSAGEILGLPTELLTNLKEESEKFSGQLLNRYISLLSRCLEEMKWSDQPRIIFETYALRLASPYLEIDEIVEKIENLEKSLTENIVLPEEKSLEIGNSKLEIVTEEQEPKVEPGPTKLPTENARPALGGGQRTTDNEERKTEIEPTEIRWTKFIEEIKKRKVTLFSYLEIAQPKELKNNILTLVFGEKFFLEGTERNEEYICHIWQELFNEKIKLNFILGELESKNNEIIEAPQVEMPKETFTLETGNGLTENGKPTDKEDTTLEPVVKKLLKHFPHARVIKTKDGSDTLPS